jgi:hypothetical protein
MDIHAHHLHKAPGQKFWHYFFEFLMLFLAVTIGFFVENQREKFIENQREKEYALSLYDDLKNDTANIQRTINEKIWIGAKYDSALKIMESNRIDENNQFIYYITRYLSFNDAFTSQDVTYQQLRSSGSFRYFDNIEFYKKIAGYYNLYNRYQMYDKYGFIADDSFPELISNLFNLTDLNTIRVGGHYTFYDLKRPADKLHPIIRNEKYIKLLEIKFASARDAAAGNIMFLNWLKTSSVDLIKEIRNEYDIGD